jgi:hypothetical protein
MLFFSFQPAIQILTSTFNRFAVWKALADEEKPPTAMQLDRPET